MPRQTFSTVKSSQALDIITIQLSLEEKMIGGGDVCVGVALRSHTLRQTVGKRHSHDFGEKTDRTEKEGDKILRGVDAAVTSSPDVLLIRSL